MTFWEHTFKCRCRHTTNRKRDLAEACAVHGLPAIRLTKTCGDVVTVRTLDGRGIKAQSRDEVPHD